MLKRLSSIEQIKKRALELAAAGREKVAVPSIPVPENNPAIKRTADDASNGQQKGGSSLPFPLAPGGKVGAPNDLIRSSFFGAIERGERIRVTDFPIVGPNNITFMLNGWRLDQIDAEIFFWIHTRAGGAAPGTRMSFKLWALLQHLGYKKPGKTDYDFIKQRLDQMSSTVVRYKRPGGMGSIGTLIQVFDIDEDTREAIVVANQYVRPFFDNVTHLSTEHAAALRGSPLALWLYRVIVSHAEWMPMLVKTVLERSGSKSAALKHFKQNLIRALNRLQENGHIHGFHFEASKGGELLYIDRTPTITQKRHIERKCAR